MKNNKIEIDKNLLWKIVDCFEDTINYANDDMIDRNDKDYKDFFDTIDKGNELIEKLCKILNEGE